MIKDQSHLQPGAPAHVYPSAPNDNGPLFPTVIHALETWATETPSREAISFLSAAGAVRYTYHDLWEAACRVAGKLTNSYAICSGQRVGLCARASANVLIAYLRLCDWAPLLFQSIPGARGIPSTSSLSSPAAFYFSAMTTERRFFRGPLFLLST